MKILMALAALVLFAAAPVNAHDFKVGEIVIDHPWARATPPRITTGAAYMTFENKGTTDDRLISASSPASAEVQFHENKDEGGVMQMRRMQVMPVPAGGSITLKPSTMHMMLVGLKDPLKVGTKVPLTLVFEKAGEVTVELVIDKPGSTGPKADEHLNH